MKCFLGHASPVSICCFIVDVCGVFTVMNSWAWLCQEWKGRVKMVTSMIESRSGAMEVKIEHNTRAIAELSGQLAEIKGLLRQVLDK